MTVHTVSIRRYPDIFGGLAVTYGSLGVGFLVGLSLTGKQELQRELSASSIFLHNEQWGLIVAIGGLATLGLVTVGMSAFSGFVNGIVIGSAIQPLGLLETAERLPHFFAESLGHSLFAAVGLLSLVKATGTLPSLSIRDAAIRTGGLLGLGTILILVAALLESRVTV